MTYLEELIRCPHCGYVETLNGYDVLGADEGCGFCAHCHGQLVLADAEAAGGE